jgi:hypothetical protein
VVVVVGGPLDGGSLDGVAPDTVDAVQVIAIAMTELASRRRPRREPSRGLPWTRRTDVGDRVRCPPPSPREPASPNIEVVLSIQTLSPSAIERTWLQRRPEAFGPVFLDGSLGALSPGRPTEVRSICGADRAARDSQRLRHLTADIALRAASHGYMTRRPHSAVGVLTRSLGLALAASQPLAAERGDRTELHSRMFVPNDADPAGATHPEQHVRAVSSVDR